MKRILLSAITVLTLLVTGFTGCGNPFAPSGTGSLTLNVCADGLVASSGTLAASAASRTILPASLLTSDLVYDYALSRAGYESKTGTALSYTDLTALEIPGLVTGDWELSITAKSAGNPLFAKSGTTSIAAGANAITWVLEPVQTGSATAGLDVDLQWPTASADTVDVYLSNDVDTLPGNPVSAALGAITDTAGASTASVTMSSQTSGTAYLTLVFKRGTAQVATVQELVQFYDNRTSVASITLLEADFSTAPDAPGAMAAHVDQATGNVQLTWIDNANTETGFKVYRDGAATALDTITVPGTITWADTTAGNGAHSYEVRAFNDFGESSPGACTLDWDGSNDSVGFTLNVSQPGQNITFALSDLFVAADGTITLSCNDTALAAQTSGWSWYVDGVLDASSSGGTFVFDPSSGGYIVGSHVLSVITTQNGVLCSGSLRVTVTPVTEANWTITYLSGDSDSGEPPVDGAVYNSTASSATLAGQGTLLKSGSDFIGWTLVSASGTYTAGTTFAAGDTLTVSGDMKFRPRWTLVSMVEIPGGTFCRDGVSSNLTTVSSFRMGKYAVTREQYQSVMSGNPNSLSANPSNNTSNTANLPVENVSWYGALVFCNRLSIQEGLEPVYSISSSTNPDDWGAVPTASDTGWDAAICNMNANGYRLATEAEWMWAAMGGLADSKTADVQSGLNMGGYLKNFAGHDGSNNYTDYVVYNLSSSQPVGSLSPNEFGLYDMSGNVNTWLWDWFNSTTVSSNTSINLTGMPKNPVGPGSGTWRHVRGGAYSNSQSASDYYLDTQLGASSARLGIDPWLPRSYAGFRVVRSGTGSTYLPRRSLESEWTFDGTDTNPVDSSGQMAGNSGYVNPGVVTARLANRHGRPASARYYTVPGTITAPKAMLMPAQAFTLSLWFKADVFPSAVAADKVHVHYILIQPGNGAGQFQYWITLDGNTQKLMVYVARNLDPVADATHVADISLNVWNHVALTWNPVSASAGELIVWVNGASSTYSNVNISDAINIDSANPKFQIGGGYWTPGLTVSDQYFAGGIDDLRIYQRALSDDEIQQLYEE